MSVPVLFQGEWMDVKVPSAFTGAMALAYASTWTSLRAKGLDESEVSMLTEAIIYQRMFPGLVYHKQLQERIKSLFNSL